MDSDLQATKKFLHEMRATRAYSYETVPPPRFFNPSLWGPRNCSIYDTIIEETTDIILALISERTGRPYKLVKVVKFLWTPEWMPLLTIEVKESVPDSVTETFLATVSYDAKQVLECFIKPDHDAPTEFITPVRRQFQKINIPNQAGHPTVSMSLAGHRNVPISVQVPLPVRVPTRIFGNSNVAARSQIFSSVF